MREPTLCLFTICLALGVFLLCGGPSEAGEEKEKAAPARQKPVDPRVDRKANQFIKYFERQIARMLDMETPVRVEALTYGEKKRLVQKVPVGGVDHLSPMAEGWKMEDIFLLTDAQQKALDGLRDEYESELRKLQEKLDEVNKAIALQVLDLRMKYEAKANGLLDEKTKKQKQRLDELAGENNQRNREFAEKKRPELETFFREEAQKAFEEARADGNMAALRALFPKGQALGESIREKVEAANDRYLEAIGAILTGHAKENLDAAVRRLKNRRDRLKGKGWKGLKDKGDKEKRKEKPAGGPIPPPAPPDGF